MDKPRFNLTQLNAAVYEYVRRDRRLNPVHRLVVIEVLDHDYARAGTNGMEKKGEAWPSQTRLAKRLGISRRTVYTAVRAAEKLGYWDFERIRFKQGRVIKYRIHYGVIHKWVLDAVEREGKDCSGVREELAHRNGNNLPKKLLNRISPNKSTKPAAPASRTRGARASSLPGVNDSRRKEEAERALLHALKREQKLLDRDERMLRILEVAAQQMAPRATCEGAHNPADEGYSRALRNVEAMQERVRRHREAVDQVERELAALRSD